MPLVHKTLKLLWKRWLNQSDLPQACNLGLYTPQTETEVWLHGMGEPRNVTSRHTIACASPFTVCIGFEGEPDLKRKAKRRLSLRFCERDGERRLLGEIGLRLSATLPVKGEELCLFETTRCANFCLPRVQMWAHNLHQMYVLWKTRKSANVEMSILGDRCNAVTFICPRPVVLVSVQDGEQGNIFPMNLLGAVGRDYFAFALNSTRQAAPLVERIGQAAISSVPFDQSATARSLGRHHYLPSIEWEQLPFKTRRSTMLGIPVPEFALRVQELKIETAQQLGSHTFFVARVVGDETYADAPEFCMIHGLYEAWRRRNRSVLTPACFILPERKADKL